MRRVVAMFSERRSNVAIRSTVGKAEKSSGLWIHSATIRIRMESEIDSARPMSITIAGSGRNSTVSINRMATAKPTSWRLLGWVGPWPDGTSDVAAGCSVRMPLTAALVTRPKPCSIWE